MITERYIKMCEKAEEIQREWKPQEGDFCIVKGYKKVFVVFQDAGVDDFGVPCLIAGHRCLDKRQTIWLPTQEQLQEMVLEWYQKKNLYDVNDSNTLFLRLRNFWMEGVYQEAILQFGTMNELLLAFVMWERYQKVWDDEKEEWVKGECNGYRH
ncbi:hypothetical protein DRQ17_00465 [bacterium]|nr:MAG: hypothetical protein DRQ17_00465 [bacterium]